MISSTLLQPPAIPPATAGDLATTTTIPAAPAGDSAFPHGAIRWPLAKTAAIAFVALIAVFFAGQHLVAFFSTLGTPSPLLTEADRAAAASASAAAAPPAVTYGINRTFGWGLMLSGFVSGAALGLFFHKPGFLGGYDSFRRRLLRLGHIAQEALGIVNIVFSLTPMALGLAGRGASIAFVLGGIAMPAVCFLAAWRTGFRHLFALPVLLLTAAVVLALIGGLQ